MFGETATTTHDRHSIHDHAKLFCFLFQEIAHPVVCVYECPGMGCFWGAERLFWRTPGVFSTQVGFAGGVTPNPTYLEVCSGITLHVPCTLFFTFHSEISRGSRDPRLQRDRKRETYILTQTVFYVQRSHVPAAFPSFAVNYSECTAPDGLHPPSPLFP